MLYNKKEEAAGLARDKLLSIVEYGKRCKQLNQAIADYEQQKGVYGIPYFSVPYFDKKDDYNKNRYFTDREKNLIIDYLIDCMIDDEPFDCSTMGPNKYLEEDDESNAAIPNTQL